ncbi:MAG: efflux RND transporter periplasmic adaptor subunit [Pseudomonadota bacterium]
MEFITINFRNSGLVPLLLVILLAGCQGDQGAAAAGNDGDHRGVNGTITVATLELSKNDFYTSRSLYTGRVDASRRSELGFELGGRLQTVSVDDGEPVRAGQVLARLDTDRLMAQLAEARAGLQQTRAQAQLTQATLERVNDAREFDGVSQQQYDEAANAAESASAAVSAAQSRLARIEVDLSKSELTAPYDAVVLRRHHDEGQVLSPGQPVFSVQDTGTLEARIGVAGDAAQQLTVGDEQPLIVNDRPLKAHVRAILPRRDTVTRTVEVVFDLMTDAVSADDASQPAQAGDLVQLELRRSIDVVGYWVPLTALVEGDRGLWNTYVVIPDSQVQAPATHRIEARPVEVVYQDGSRAYVKGALDAGDRLIPKGLNRVVPGQQVRLQDGAQR